MSTNATLPSDSVPSARPVRTAWCLPGIKADMTASTTDTPPPYLGRSFEVNYGPAMTALNIYAEDGRTMRYEVTSGPFTGASAQVQYEAKQVAPGVYVLSWQETDRGSVVHVDDFASGTSFSFYTTATLDLVRMSGSLHRV